MDNNTPDLLPDNEAQSEQDIALAVDIVQETPPRIAQGWLRALLYFVGFFIFNAIFQLLGLGLGTVITGIEFKDAIAQLQTGFEVSLLLPMQMSVMLGTILLTWIFRTQMDRRSFKSLGWEWVGKQKDALTGFALGMSILAAGFVILYSLDMLEIVKK